jgi:phage baseplate assembly protein W
MNIDFPYHVGPRGRTAVTDDDEHIRDMIKLVLLTSPGERVNRPDFGCGLLKMVFESGSPEIASALEFTIRGALQRWLGDVIEPGSVRVASEDSKLHVAVSYTVRRTGSPGTASFLMVNGVILPGSSQ